MDPHAPARPAPGFYILLAILLIGVPAGPLTLPTPARGDGMDLLAMSLEALMQVPVISASARAHTVADVPGAVHVLTAEDVRRSGARTVPDLLRQVPGLDVAELNNHTWAVSARGFNGRYANMLLVLVDGRSVYTPMFGGVYWDAQNIPLDEVERVEVILGPAGTLWGANAVNGVINIITKDAADTVGVSATGGLGSRERAYVAAHQGTALPGGGHLRLYLQAFDRESAEWNESRGGFRYDARGPFGHISVHGASYSGRAERQTYLSGLSPPATVVASDIERIAGGHLMLGWRRGGDEDGWAGTAYFDRAERSDAVLDQRVTTADLNLRRFRRLGAHGLAAGVGARRVADRMGNSFTAAFTPDRRADWWTSAFLQDEVTLAPDLRLTVGTKLEHNPYTGYEHQPSAHLLWRPAPRHLLWGAVSRAVRVPSRGHRDGRLSQTVIPGSPPVVVAVLGSPDTASTVLTAFEAGYRGRPHDAFTLDLAAFLDRYDRANTVEPGTPFLETDPAPDHLVSPLYVANRAGGLAWGAEAEATWQAAARLRVQAGYTWLRMNLRVDPGSGSAATIDQVNGGSPEQQVRLALRADPTATVALDAAAQVVDQLPALGVPAYVRLALRAAWTLRPGLSFSLAGDNLLARRHREYAAAGPTETVVETVPRTVMARVTWAP